MSAEVKVGYKQSEVGVIPEDWYQSTIGELSIKVGSGITPRGGNSNYKDYGRPFVRSQNVGWGNLRLDDLVYIEEETHNCFASTELKEADVLLNITGASIGRSALVDKRLVGGNVNQHVCVIRVNQTASLPGYINYFLLSVFGQAQIDSFQAGGNREGLNFGQIKSIKLSLPANKAEQEAILEALSDADALIDSLEQLITKKRHIKQGAMQELLTGKKRLPGFSGEWEVVKAEDIGRFRGGSGFPSQFQGVTDAEFPFFKVSDMNNVDNETFMETANNYISETQRKQLGATAFPMKSIVIAKVGAAIFLERKRILDKPRSPDAGRSRAQLLRGAPRSEDLRRR